MNAMKRAVPAGARLIGLLSAAEAPPPAFLTAQIRVPIENERTTPNGRQIRHRKQFERTDSANRDDEGFDVEYPL